MTAPNEMPPPPGAGPAAPAAAPAQPPAAGGPNIGAILKRMVAHLWVGAIVLGLGLGITMVLMRSRKPAFVSETVVYYREGVKRELVGAVGGDGDNLKALPARLKETLLSRAYLEKIIREFNLYPQIVQLEGYVAAVEKFRTKITFKARSAETFLIAFEGSTAEEAQEVTTRLADVLIEDMAERKKAQAKTTTEFLDTEKKRSDDDLATAEKDLTRFVAEHPEFAAENNAEQAGSGVRTEKMKAVMDPTIQALDRQQQRLRAALGGKAAPGAAVPGVAAPAGAAAPDPQAVALLQAKQAADKELADAQKDLTDKSQRLTDAHPDVRMAKVRFDAAKVKARDAEMAFIAGTPNPAAEPAGGGAAPAAPAKADDDPYDSPDTGKSDNGKSRLQSELAANERELANRKRGSAKPDASVNGAADRIVALETEWRTLNRAREKAKRRQGEIDERLFKAEANAALELGGYNAQVMVLDPAFLPSQDSTMPLKKFILIGILASIVAGLVFSAAYGMFFDDRLFVADEVSAFAPILAVIPKSPDVEKGKKRRA